MRSQNLNYQNQIYEQYLKEQEETKDMNKLVQLLNNANIYFDLHLDNYFSRDKFDLIYLKDKEKKKKDNFNNKSDLLNFDITN